MEEKEEHSQVVGSSATGLLYNSLIIPDENGEYFLRSIL